MPDVNKQEVRPRRLTRYATILTIPRLHLSGLDLLTLTLTCDPWCVNFLKHEIINTKTEGWPIVTPVLLQRTLQSWPWPLTFYLPDSIARYTYYDQPVNQIWTLYVFQFLMTYKPRVVQWVINSSKLTSWHGLWPLACASFRFVLVCGCDIAITFENGMTMTYSAFCARAGELDFGLFDLKLHFHLQVPSQIFLPNLNFLQLSVFWVKSHFMSEPGVPDMRQTERRVAMHNAAFQREDHVIKHLYKQVYLMAQKMSHWTKCNFSTTDKDFSSKFQDLQHKEFSTILENVAEIFSLLQELQLLQYFIPYFIITKKKWTVTLVAILS